MPLSTLALAVTTYVPRTCQVKTADATPCEFVVAVRVAAVAPFNEIVKVMKALDTGVLVPDCRLERRRNCPRMCLWVCWR